jgi:selenide,water dikinase
MSALRAEKADRGIIKAATDSMERLNRYAAEKFSSYPIHACTDVTGFGLLVHASEIAGSEHTLVIESGALPLLPGVLDFANDDYITAGGERNRNYMEGKADIDGASSALQEIAFDPQTSGGLLISLPAEYAQALCDDIRRDDPAAAIIGKVTPRGDCPVVLL